MSVTLGTLALGSAAWSLGSSLLGGLFGMNSADAAAAASVKAAKIARQTQLDINFLNRDLTERQNALNRQMTYDINASQLAENRYLSNTAHQREVKDLRAAGLNPILSANSGATANVPSLSVPEQDTPQYGVEGFLQSAKLTAEAEKIRARAMVDALRSVDLKGIFKSALEAEKLKAEADRDSASAVASAEGVRLRDRELDLRSSELDLLQKRIENETSLTNARIFDVKEGRLVDWSRIQNEVEKIRNQYELEKMKESGRNDRQAREFEELKNSDIVRQLSNVLTTLFFMRSGRRK